MFQYKCSRKQLASLNVIEYKGDPLAPTIIFFHGYGGNASSFSFFPSYCMQKDQNIVPNWIFPEGTLTIDSSSERSWFPIRITKLLNTSDNDNPKKVNEAFPLDISPCTSLVKNMLAETDISPSKVILGGFSQGAVLSTEIFLTSELDYSAVVIMAGTLINSQLWETAASKKTGRPFLQTHGKNDDILPWSLAKKLENLLIDHGLQGELDSFEGGHQIPEILFLKLNNLIKSVANDE